MRRSALAVSRKVASASIASRRSVRLVDLTKVPLILYERGSTGRQHVLDAFHERALTPRIALETTSTETIISMVEAGLGVSIVPLLASGAVTRARNVAVAKIRDEIRPIHSGILRRRRESMSPAAARLLAFITSQPGGV